MTPSKRFVVLCIYSSVTKYQIFYQNKPFWGVKIHLFYHLKQLVKIYTPDLVSQIYLVK